MTAPRAFRPVPIALTALAAVAVAHAPMPGLGPQAHGTLVILVTVIGLWFTEALPIVVPALLVPVLAVMLGAAGPRQAFAGFGDPIVFLFMGTFLLTEAAAAHGLNARLARAVVHSRWVRAQPGHLVWALALLGCAISAWVNNTATAAMLLPLALAAERFGQRPLLVAALLMVAYAPSLGGFATPVGSAPNLIGLGLIADATGTRPSFAQWIVLFAPLAVLFTLLPVFGLVVALWIGPGLLAATPLGATPWLALVRERMPEAAVPLLGALLLFVLPSGAPAADGGTGFARGARILDVSVLRRLDWSTLLLFGGGLSLGSLMFDTGLARWIGEGLSGLLRLEGSPLSGTFGVVFVSTLLAVVVSEITSNTASAALVVPVAIALGQVAGVDPVKPALAATVGCSFGFMLPVSTPPNALVYATGRLRIREMIANGLLLDVAGVLLVSAWVTLFG